MKIKAVTGIENDKLGMYIRDTHYADEHTPLVYLSCFYQLFYKCS